MDRYMTTAEIFEHNRLILKIRENPIWAAREIENLNELIEDLKKEKLEE